jgi:hypothetical protein
MGRVAQELHANANIMARTGCRRSFAPVTATLIETRAQANRTGQDSFLNKFLCQAHFD